MDQQRLFDGINNNDDNKNNIQALSRHSSVELEHHTENTYTGDSTHDRLITTLGVSKKLGSSVLNELDTRTNAKFEQLFVSNNDNTEPLTDLTFSERFNIIHNSQFKAMESLDTHYRVKIPSRHDNDNNDNIYKTPSKKNLQTEQLQSSSVKRLKTTQNLLNTPPPILDITRRIRRLRLRNSLSHNSNNIKINVNTISSSSSSSSSGYGIHDNYDSRSIVNSKIRNTPITKPQKPLEPPSFLRPTVTSLNRMKRSDKINDINSKIRPLKTRVPTTTNNKTTTSMNSPFQTKDKEIPDRERSSRRVKSTGNVVSNSNESLSVFERLYKQSTVSRSISMNNVTNDKSTKKNEEINERNNKIAGTYSNDSNPPTIKFGRSKTTSGLSDHIKTRPAWK